MTTLLTIVFMSKKIGSAEPKAVLKQYFGYDDFRPGQSEIIEAIVSGRDVLAILPTGGGKSLCFQVPALCLGGTTIVISPLISLMQDQIANLVKHGINATLINSTLDSAEQAERLQKMAAGVYRFVYVAPEKLGSRVFQQACRQARVRFVALDEAHCLSLWGHDFRPSYLQIIDFLDAVFGEKKRPVIAAYTASATPAVVADILQHGGLRPEALIVQRSFARTNLEIFVKHCRDHHHKLLCILRLLKKHRGQSGIIYVLTRKRAEELVARINQLTRTWRGAPLAYYHGGQESKLRAKIQDDFIAGRVPVIVATNAFGMGVDKPDVRFVIHDQISSNLENYYQEIGRGGRDGEIARCYALVTASDLEINHRFITASRAPREQKQVLRHKLAAIEKYLETAHCRQRQILDYFAEENHVPCGHCDQCQPGSDAFAIDEAEHKDFLSLLQVRKDLARRDRLIATTICTQLALNYAAALGASVWDKPQIVPGFGQGFLQNFARHFARVARD